MPVVDTAFRRVDESCLGDAQSELDVDASNGDGSDGIVYNPLRLGDEIALGRSVLSGSFAVSLNIGELNVSSSSASSGLVRTSISGPAPVISMIGVSGRGDSFGDMTYNKGSRKIGEA